MSSHKSKKKSPKYEIQGISFQAIDFFISVPLLIVTGILPCIVRAALVPLAPEMSELVYGTHFDDMFSYYKSWLLLLSAGFILAYFISDILTGGKRYDIKRHLKNPAVIAALVYIFFVILSNIFSKYPYTALRGVFNRYEGVLTQMAYIVIFLTALFYVRSWPHAKLALAGLLLSSIIAGLIGFSQFIRHDFFTTPLGSLLVTGQVEELTPAFTQAYGTSFNPNTFGLFTATLTPLLLLAAFSYDGHWLVKVLLWLGGGLMMLGIVGSWSLGGIAGAFASILVIAIILLAKLIYNYKGIRLSAFVVLACIIVMMGVAYKTLTPFQNSVAYVTKKAKAIFNAPVAPARDYVFENGSLKAVNRNGEIRIYYNPQSEDIMISNANGEPVQGQVTGEDDTSVTYTYEADGYGKFSIAFEEGYFIFDRMYLSVVDGRVTPLTRGGKPIDIEAGIPTIGFEGREAWGTGRGYIWSRSIPLALAHPILGSGSDSFILEFPQNDIVGKAKFLETPYTVVDKAHNLYLQTAITTGGVSLLALLFLFGGYIITTFVSLVKSRGERLLSFGLRLGTLASVCAYAVSSISTDSTVSSAPVFWVILGVGYAMNRLPLTQNTDEK